MNADELKRQAAEASIEFLPESGIIGVGTGSTVNHFIDAFAAVKGRFEGAVSSSEASTERMKKLGIPVLDLNATGGLEVYVDGADESHRQLHLINGAGGNAKAATTGRVNMKDVGDPDFFNLDPEAFKFCFDLNFLGTFMFQL